MKCCISVIAVIVTVFALVFPGDQTYTIKIQLATLREIKPSVSKEIKRERKGFIFCPIFLEIEFPTVEGRWIVHQSFSPPEKTLFLFLYLH